MSRELLFSLTKKDFTIQTFRAGGKGGQNQNKRSTGVRIIHTESGARGEARDSRHQHINKTNAFKRLLNSKEFKIWHKKKCAEVLQTQQEKEEQTRRINAQVDEQMQEKYLKIEYGKE